MVSISAHQTLDGKVRIEGSYQPTENEMRSIQRLIERMTKGGAGVSYHARRRYVHVASPFPWRTIIGRCRDRFHKQEIIEKSVYRWTGMRKF